MVTKILRLLAVSILAAFIFVLSSGVTVVVQSVFVTYSEGVD